MSVFIQDKAARTQKSGFTVAKFVFKKFSKVDEATICSIEDIEEKTIEELKKAISGLDKTSSDEATKELEEYETKISGEFLIELQSKQKSLRAVEIEKLTKERDEKITAAQAKASKKKTSKKSKKKSKQQDSDSDSEDAKPAKKKHKPRKKGDKVVLNDDELQAVISKMKNKSDWEIRQQGGEDFLEMLEDANMSIKMNSAVTDVISVIKERLSEKNKTL